MKFIYVLEDDVRFRNDLYEALSSIDPKLHIRFFTNLAEFHEWLKIALHEGPKALAKGGTQFHLDQTPPLEPATNHELRLVITKNEFLGVQNMNLIRRARDFFVRKKMCGPEEPTALILTSFDDPTFDIKLAEDRIINNVIFKPFDKLILKQDLEYALTGQHPPKSSENIATFKLNLTIEMLKEAPLVSLSEIGFTTTNNHEIKIGSFSKYYGDFFKVENKKSVFATCSACKEISQKEFLCEFHFFAADSEQVQNIRRAVLSEKTNSVIEIKNTRQAPTKILIIDETTNTGINLKVFLAERFSNLDIYFYSEYLQCFSDLSDKETAQAQRLPREIDYVFANYDLFELEKESRWEQLRELIKSRNIKIDDSGSSPELFLFSQKRIPADELRALAPWTKDVFFTPLDKLYIAKKITSDFSAFNNKNPLTITSTKKQAKIKIANSIPILQISEAGLVMKYYRALSIGSFRDFILWRPNEADSPEIKGTVNFHEENDGPENYFLNHFVFFGMKDNFLKHIRLWMREVYIKKKESE